MADTTKLAGALAAFQAELPKLVKDETANVTGKNKEGGTVKYKYGYADLAQVCETVLPVLGKHGLSVTSKTTFTEGSFVLEVSLLHESGEHVTGYWPLPDPRRAGPQDLGSAITYGRRYLTLALTGTFPGGEDDDGAQAQQSARDNWENAQPRSQQAHDQHRRGVNNTDEPAPAEPPKDWSQATDTEIGELHKRIETLPIGQAVNGYDWMAGKGLHNRAIGIPDSVNPDTGKPFQTTATEVLAVRLADEAVRPGADAEQIAICWKYAETRGLLKVMVSESTTLGEELDMARDMLLTPHPQDG